MSYRIIGGDQREYGPVTADQIRDWIRQGRANHRTLVRFEEGDWIALESHPEFAASFTLTPAPPKPPLLARAPTPSKRMSGMAIWGLVVSALGMVCCGPLFSTIGLVLCLVAIAQINSDPQQEGKALAVTGIVLALIGYLLFTLLLLTGLWQEIFNSF